MPCPDDEKKASVTSTVPGNKESITLNNIENFKKTMQVEFL